MRAGIPRSSTNPLTQKFVYDVPQSRPGLSIEILGLDRRGRCISVTAQEVGHGL